MEPSNRLLSIALLLFLPVLFLGCNETEDPGGETERPNIIVLLSDDMGYSDVGSYGASVIETPEIDSLAYNGLRFTQFYNTGRCVPSRASLLAGQYPHQTGLGFMTADDQLPGYRGDMNDRSVTVAQLLSDAGYSTYMSGKWHVTPYRPQNPDKHNWPLQRGFDRFFGTISGAGSYYDPSSLVRGNEYIAPHQAGEEYTNENFYYTTAISDHAVRYINDHEEGQSDNPFFMYVSYTAPHWPLQAPEDEIEKYEGKFDMGWDELRQQRYQRMKEMGLIDEDWDLSDRDSKVPAWDQVENKDWQTRRMEVYAAMIDMMDQGIGRIVDALERNGELENTLVLFLHDNGGNLETLDYFGKKDYSEHEGIGPPDRDEPQTEMLPKVTRQGEPVQHGNIPEYMPGPPDTYQAYGRPWGNVSNTPFREYKHFVHEGGAATPLIAHWPAGIQREGELERQPGHLVDLMPTFLELADATYPETYEGSEINPMQGVSLEPAFRGNAFDREEPLFFEHEGNRALRDGRWKVVAKNPTGDWELYDMEADRTETNNLADEHPERVKDMVQKWESMARRFNAIPWPYEGKYGE